MQDSIAKLIGTAVEVSIGEPWDFGKGKERNPFEAVIDKISVRHLSRGKKVELQEALLLRVKQPFPYSNVKCEFLLAKPRHVGIGLKEFFSGELVCFNFTRIPSDLALTDDPFQIDLTERRKKYFGLIGSLTRL